MGYCKTISPYTYCLSPEQPLTYFPREMFAYEAFMRAVRWIIGVGVTYTGVFGVHTLLVRPHHAASLPKQHNTLTSSVRCLRTIHSWLEYRGKLSVA